MSAPGNTYASPPVAGIEFHFDRRKAALIGSGTIVAGIAIACPPAASQALQGAPGDAAAAIIALAGAISLVAAGLFVLLRICLWRGPAVVINGIGIHDRRRGAIMTPWSCVEDIRPLDRHGRHIAIATHPTLAPLRPRTISYWRSDLSYDGTIVIDTFFLKSATGNRVLDFVMPFTALTPIDLSDTPVSDAALSADAALARRYRNGAIAAFVMSAVIPALAAFFIAF